MSNRDFAQSHDGLRIRYEVRGAGEPLALIMGFSGSGRAWGEPFLSRLEKRFRLVVIDNRGTGESDQPDRSWTLGDMASDVARVLDRARIDRAHIYGISMGGMIAQEFALAYPSRTRGLVLGCTNCGMKNGVQAAPEVVGALMPSPDLSPEEQARRAFSVACGKAFIGSKAGQDFLTSMMMEMANYPLTPMHTYFRQFEAITAFDSFLRLGQIASPTLVIHGDDDALVPHPNAEILAKGIRGAKLHIIKGAGHMFFWEAVDEAVRVPGDFLDTAK